MPQYSTSHRSNAMADLISQAGATACLLLYAGTEPANCAAAETGTLLAILPCNPVLGTVSGGVLTLNGSTLAVAANAANPVGTGIAQAGTATHWRLCTTAAGISVVAQGTIGSAGAELTFQNGPTFLAGQQVNLTGMTITAAGA